MRIAVSAIIFSAALVLPVAADELSQASHDFCEKLKGCALEQMGDADGMSEQIKAQITASVDTMCTGMEQNFKAAGQSHALYEPAVACMRSITRLSCARLEQFETDGTPECAEYEAMAEQHR